MLVVPLFKPSSNMEVNPVYYVHVISNNSKYLKSVWKLEIFCGLKKHSHGFLNNCLWLINCTIWFYWIFGKACLLNHNPFWSTGHHYVSKLTFRTCGFVLTVWTNQIKNKKHSQSCALYWVVVYTTGLKPNAQSLIHRPHKIEALSFLHNDEQTGPSIV